MIAILGDIHFSASKPYFIKVSEDFIKWFDGWDYNNSENELILAGDLVAYAVNGGLVNEFLFRFITASRFKHVHIVTGNHDKKMKDGIQQLAYSFLDHYPNVTIYDELTIATIQGLKVLLMPFYKATGFQKTMKERYSSLYKEKKYQQNFDLLVGHFSDEQVHFASSDTVNNLGKLNVKKICLGHIHKRIDPSRYIGSVYANKVNENATDRAAWIIDRDGAYFEDLLPNFLEFLTVKYPDPLPHSDSLTPVYTITHCSGDKVAKEKYGNIFIKTTLRGIEKSSFGEEFNSSSILDVKIDEVFKEFLHKQAPPVDRRVAKTCLSLLNNSTNFNNGNV